jgi:hypothetical protein
MEIGNEDRDAESEYPRRVETDSSNEEEQSSTANTNMSRFPGWDDSATSVRFNLYPIQLVETIPSWISWSV